MRTALDPNRLRGFSKKWASEPARSDELALGLRRPASGRVPDREIPRDSQARLARSLACMLAHIALAGWQARFLRCKQCACACVLELQAKGWLDKQTVGQAG